MARAIEEQGLIDTWLRERGDPNWILLNAVRRGYLRALVYVLDTAGVSVHDENEIPRSIVYEAAGAPNEVSIKCIQALLDRGAILSSDPAKNPLHAACANNNHQTVAWLLQQPEASALMASVSAYSGRTAFGIAVNSGNCRCMCLLLQHGYTATEVDLRTDRGGMARAIVANRNAYERFVVVMAIARFRKREARLSVDLLRDVARLVWPGPWKRQ